MAETSGEVGGIQIHLGGDADELTQATERYLEKLKKVSEQADRTKERLGQMAKSATADPGAMSLRDNFRAQEEVAKKKRELEEQHQTYARDLMVKRKMDETDLAKRTLQDIQREADTIGERNRPPSWDPDQRFGGDGGHGGHGSRQSWQMARAIRFASGGSVPEYQTQPFLQMGISQGMFSGSALGATVGVGGAIGGAVAYTSAMVNQYKKLGEDATEYRQSLAEIAKGWEEIAAQMTKTTETGHGLLGNIHGLMDAGNKLEERRAESEYGTGSVFSTGGSASTAKNLLLMGLPQRVTDNLRKMAFDAYQRSYLNVLEMPEQFQKQANLAGMEGEISSGVAGIESRGMEGMGETMTFQERRRRSRQIEDTRIAEEREGARRQLAARQEIERDTEMRSGKERALNDYGISETDPLRVKKIEMMAKLHAEQRTALLNQQAVEEKNLASQQEKDEVELQKKRQTEDREYREEREREARSNAGQVEDAHIRATKTGIESRFDLIEAATRREIKEYEIQGKDTKVLKERESEQIAVEVKNRNIALGDIERDFQERSAKALHPEQAIEEDWKKMARGLTREWGLTGQALEYFHQQFVKTAKDEANHTLIIQAKELNLQYQQLTGQIGGLEAAYQRLKLANPKADEKELREAALAQTRAQSFGAVKGSVYEGHPELQFKEFAQSMSDALKSGALDEPAKLLGKTPQQLAEESLSREAGKLNRPIEPGQFQSHQVGFYDPAGQGGTHPFELLKASIVHGNQILLEIKNHTDPNNVHRIPLH